MILLCAVIMASIGIALFMRRKMRGIIVHNFGVVYSFCDLLNEFFVKFLSIAAATEAA